MGAKSKLTDEVEQKIVSAIEHGSYEVPAVEAAGISKTTYYRWLEEGEGAKSGRKRDFWEAVERARGASEVTLVEIIHNAAPGDWNAAKWLLERRFSSRWANVQKIDIAVEKEMDTLVGVLEDGLDPTVFAEVMGVLAGSEKKA